MDLIEYFPHPNSCGTPPARMPDPFDTRPHPLAICAADALRARLDASEHWRSLLHRPQGGKMFGVLVLRDETGRLGYASAFSGMLDQQWLQPGFASPLFDVTERAAIMAQGEARLAHIGEQLQALQQHSLRRQWQDKIGTESARLEQQLQTLKRQQQTNRIARHQQREQSPGAARLEALSQQSQHDKRRYKQARQHGLAYLNSLRQQLDDQFEMPIDALEKQRKKLSRRLQLQLFDG